MTDKSTFCILPWIHLSTNNDGKFRPCCFANQSNTYNINNNTYEEYMLSDYNLHLRTLMLNGEWHPDCNRCQSEEALTKTSKRTQSNNSFKQKAINAGYTFELNSVNAPLFLDIRPSNKCNLKCKMCNSTSSSLIGIEEQQKDPLITLEHTAIEEIKRNITCNTTELYILGGETTVMDEVLDLIEYVDKNNYIENLHFRTNINGTVLPNVFLSAITKFKMTSIAVSIDGYDEVNNYIRYPSKWSKIEQNLSTLYQLALENISINLRVCVTVQSLNILSLDKFLSWLEQFTPGIKVELLLLTEPKEFSIYMLPFAVRERIHQSLNRDYNLQLYRFKHILTALLKDNVDYSQYKNSFWTKSNRQDNYRGVSLEQTLPEVYKILKS